MRGTTRIISMYKGMRVFIRKGLKFTRARYVRYIKSRGIIHNTSKHKPVIPETNQPEIMHNLNVVKKKKDVYTRGVKQMYTKKDNNLYSSVNGYIQYNLEKYISTTKTNKKKIKKNTLGRDFTSYRSMYGGIRVSNNSIVSISKRKTAIERISNNIVTKRSPKQYSETAVHARGTDILKGMLREVEPYKGAPLRVFFLGGRRILNYKRGRIFKLNNKRVFKYGRVNSKKVHLSFGKRSRIKKASSDRKTITARTVLRPVIEAAAKLVKAKVSPV